eukprot:CAMPEP_0114128224 /NCGR_PEP_ID=MMETSP0043_2-20121206/10815_1 /TAXON_ID=464988 /ORGANISM="Hemiselmis andersenii, Strain CCMP644" /LENGTH=86 /DNA_ID=CAMNT_0001221393 /DNA_START=224 /DNA_END=484 /DNA_ORIENTATION=-
MRGCVCTGASAPETKDANSFVPSVGFDDENSRREGLREGWKDLKGLLRDERREGEEPGVWLSALLDAESSRSVWSGLMEWVAEDLR